MDDKRVPINGVAVVALVLATLTLLPGCTAAPKEVSPLAEVCPGLSAAEVEAIDDYAAKPGIAFYARSYCVSIDEAERRMAIQGREDIGPRTEPGPVPEPPAISTGALTAALQANEAATFAGVWIQHRPDYGVVVAFTRDAAETLARYTADPLFMPLDRPGPTLAELHQAQERLTREFTAHGFRWATASVREDHGVVEFDLAQEAGPIRAAAARGAFALPAWVVLNEPAPLPFAAPPPPAPGDTRVRAFPQLAFRTDMYVRTLAGVPDIPATLRLQDGCLVLDMDGVTRTALWQASDALDRSDPARVAVVNRLDGVRVAEGDDIVLMGLQPGEEKVPEDIVGTSGCGGPYQQVRGFLPRAEWEARQREWRIDMRERVLGDRAAATADYEADRARLPAMRAWRDRLLAGLPDVVAAIWLDEDDATAYLFHTSARSSEELVPSDLAPFVETREAPVGHGALESARASLERQLGEAGVEATLHIDPAEGVVYVSPADPRALSEAAVAGAITFPGLARVSQDGASALSYEAAREGVDPDAPWFRLEAAPDFSAIRALVEATELPVIEPLAQPSPGAGPVQPAAPRRARPGRANSLRMAHYLVAYGQTAAEIAALREHGFDPVDAVDAMNGRSTPVTRALLARDVVVAELVSLETRAAHRDGFRSGTKWRVVETLKGRAQPGAVLHVRMISGEDADGRIAQAVDEPLVLPGLPGSLEPGGRWLLHLNDALYLHQAFVHGGEGAAREDARWHVSAFAPAPVVDDVLLAPLPGQQPCPLAQLRAALAPLQAAVRVIGPAYGGGR